MDLLTHVGTEPGIARLLAARSARGALVVQAATGIRPALLALLAARGPLVIVTATGRDADELAAAIATRTGPDTVAVLPAWETLPHERLSPRADTVARRLSVFRRLAHPRTTPTGPIGVLVVPIRALLQPVVAGLGDLAPVALAVGDTADLTEVTEALAAAAYTRVDMVERRGEFAVRGGILDVFPPTDDHPARIEFWDNEVDSIRRFSVADQRSLPGSEDSSVWAPACRELLLTDEVRAKAAALVPDLPGATDMLDKMAAGIAVEGMESLAPALTDLVPVSSLLEPESLVVVVDPERVRRRAHDLVATSDEFREAAWSGAAAGGATPLDLRAASFATLAETRSEILAGGLGWWQIASFGVEADEAEPDGIATDDTPGIVVDATDAPAYHGDLERARADLAELASAGWTVVLTTAGRGSAERMADQLAGAGIPAAVVDRPAVQAGLVQVAVAPAWPGYRAGGLRVFLVDEHDLTGRIGTSTRDMRRLPSRRRDAVDPLTLRAGDYVVHDQHGVGRFVELTTRTTGKGDNAVTREYLVLEYAPAKRGQPNDRLYVPNDQLHLVTKYTGGETPSLNSLGGSDWAKTKGRARKAVREIAAELIRLYSARMATTGFAFSPDTPWQGELENAFAYVETADQLASIDEVKADMEKTMPMDRLISGDVGYGKTEIAVRAAFKAVQDGKQVAVLVPTTLLVQQHYETFAERYAPFPVTVKALSRFQSDAEAAEVLDGLASGAIDVVIGTHRLLTGSVQFKDLGLVVVDEEQRFGVEHKETLKALRTNVDVLAMSATPIPRTLEMAITGIREMSTLATPPEERHPVLTFVGPYDEKQVVAAIRRELLREGQVFYVHNRVASIDKAARRIAGLVPEARIGVAHGKMNEHQLEQIIIDFWEKRIDVLVCTTIIETGLDIANANTLILERADLLGLSQLHQLRGRVGRGRERAYAYFFYPPDVPLTETAHDRLATIAANTELGSGMAVALKDLEIRGAGNLLGSEQSGHIEGVGFDLYVRMVGEAVAAFKGETKSEIEVRVEIPVDAHLPTDYIGSERLRLEAYRKIAGADTESLAGIRAELVDRYGPIPPEADALFDVAAFRARARDIGLAEVTMQGKYLRLVGLAPTESTGLRLRRIFPGTVLKPAIRQVLVPVPTTASIGGEPITGAALLDWAGRVLDVLGGPV